MNSFRKPSRWLGLGLVIAALTLATLVAWSQHDWRRGERDKRGGVENWGRDEELPNDTFTFARIQYDSRGGSWRGRGKWSIDYPESDLNMSFRKALRKYLLTGGFLMVDDFWGEKEWQNFEREFRRVFPTREIIELPLEHEIFQSVFPLKEKPQVPNPRTAIQGASRGITWERWDAETPHYRGVYDDDGRLMVIICHNTDLGDGWEEESRAGEWYFKEFSEPRAYPMGINIIFYSMTH
jgi:hypothetical protein